MELPTKFQQLGKWLWILAIFPCSAGIAGHVAFRITPFSVFFLIPHLAEVGLTALGGWRHPWAAVTGLAGSVSMAGLTWWEILERQTEGFEWQFNNEMGESICGHVNYFVLAIVVCVDSILFAAMDHQKANAGASLQSGETSEQGEDDGKT